MPSGRWARFLERFSPVKESKIAKPACERQAVRQGQLCVSRVSRLAGSKLLAGEPGLLSNKAAPGCGETPVQGEFPDL